MVLGDDGQARRNAGYANLVAGPLDEDFGAARLGRRQKNAVGGAGNVFFRAKHPDVGLHLVVVRRHILVADGPVIAHAVVRTRLEVHGSKAQRDPAPVVGAPPHYARAEPVEGGPGSAGIGLSFDAPEAVGSEELVVHRFDAVAVLAAHALAPVGQVVGPHVLLEVACRNHRRPRLQQHHIEAAFSENLGGGASGGAGTDDADVVNLGRANYLEHESTRSNVMSELLKIHHQLIHHLLHALVGIVGVGALKLNGVHAAELGLFRNLHAFGKVEFGFFPG